MVQSATRTAALVQESVGNFPIEPSKQAFLRLYFENGGDSEGAARVVFPKHRRPDKKGLALKRQLAPFIRLAAMEYTEQLRPVALGVVVQFMKGEIPDTPAAVRLKAAEIVLDRADRMIPKEEGGTKGDGVEELIRQAVLAVGFEMAKTILTSRKDGVPLALFDKIAQEAGGIKQVEHVEVSDATDSGQEQEGV